MRRPRRWAAKALCSPQRSLVSGTNRMGVILSFVRRDGCLSCQRRWGRSACRGLPVWHLTGWRRRFASEARKQAFAAVQKPQRENKREGFAFPGGRAREGRRFFMAFAGHIPKNAPSGGAPLFFAPLFCPPFTPSGGVAPLFYPPPSGVVCPPPLISRPVLTAAHGMGAVVANCYRIFRLNFTLGPSCRIGRGGGGRREFCGSVQSRCRGGVGWRCRRVRRPRSGTG